MSAILEAIQRVSRRTPPDDFIPVMACDADTDVFVTSDGHLGLCYQGSPIIGADDETAAMLEGAISLPLPPDSFLQFSIIGMPDISQTIGRYVRRRESGLHRIANATARRTLESYYKARAAFMEAAALESNLPGVGTLVHNRRVIVSLKVPYKGNAPTPEEVAELAEIGTKLAEALQSCGLFCQRMDAADYIDLAYRLTHPFDKRRIDPVRDDELLRSQVLEPGFSMTAQKDSVIFNEDTHAWLLTAGRWPKSNALSLMAYALGDPLGANNQIRLPYHINLTMHFPAQAKKVSSERRKAAAISYQAFGPMLRFVPRLAFKKEGMDILIDSIEQGATIVEAALTVCVYGHNREECARQVSTLRTYYQSFDLAMGEERYVVLPTFWNAFPLAPNAETIKGTFRFKTMAAGQATTFLPIVGEWKGTSTASDDPNAGAAILLQSRRGQLMTLDLYDSDTNYNAVIFATSGSGKSFLTGAIINDYLSMGAKIWVIDVGRSYYKLAKLLGGSFIEFSATSGLCLNPFSHVIDIDEDVQLIKAIIEKMAAPLNGLDEYRRSRLEESVKAVWGRLGRAATITDVAEYLTAQTDTRVSDVGKMLFTFTRNGSEGYWFDGEANIDLDNDLVVLELEELKARKTLQQVVLMQLISTIQREMFLSQSSGDNRPKILIVDEAWDLLKDPMMASFFEDGYRRFRKYDGAAIVVTQGIDDLYNSASGRAIASHSAFKLVLRQEASAVEDVRANKRLPIGEHGYRVMSTVHTVPGRYSEILLTSDRGYGVARLVVDDFTKVLLATKGAARTRVMEAIENGQAPADAIKEFMEAGVHA